MCQISVVNLHDAQLNQKLFMIMGTLGSPIHSDGWGLCSPTGSSWKCSLPMHWTTDAGKMIRKHAPTDDKILLGHIRQASPQVPVLTMNSHPFVQDDIQFSHNGKLTPKDEKKFVLEYEVEDLDKEGKKQHHKDGTVKMKKVKHSDSLIFFQRFMEIWKEHALPGNSVDDTFVKVLNLAMSEFYGKFAFTFTINGQVYIVRGRSADLHMTLLKKNKNEDAPSIGWAINTDKKVLDDSCILLSNLHQIEGHNPLVFTIPFLLKEESIFKAGETSLQVIGEIKENYAPVTSTTYDYNRGRAAGDGNFTTSGTAKTSGVGGSRNIRVENLTRTVYEFMQAYMLSPQDIQNILLAVYDSSALDLTEKMLENFVQKVIPELKANVPQPTRRALRKVLGTSYVGHFHYRKYGLHYPWILSPVKVQEEFAESVRKDQ